MNLFKKYTFSFLVALALFFVAGTYDKAEAYVAGSQTVVSSNNSGGSGLQAWYSATNYFKIFNFFLSVSHQVTYLYFAPNVTVGTQIYFNYDYLNGLPFFNASGGWDDSPYGSWCPEGSASCGFPSGTSAFLATIPPGWVQWKKFTDAINVYHYDPSIWLPLSDPGVTNATANESSGLITAQVFPVLSSNVTYTSDTPGIISCSGSTCTAIATGVATITAHIPALNAQLGVLGLDSGTWASWHLGVTLPANFLPATTVSFTFGVGVAVNQAPTAIISSPTPFPVTTPIPVNQGDSLLFDGTGTDPDGTVASYEWTYGLCGGALLSSSQSFDLNTIPGFPLGTTVIYLRVKDNQGAWSTNCPSRTVVVNPPAPDLTVTVAPTVSGTLSAGQTLTFNGTIQNIGAAAVSGSFNNKFVVAPMSGAATDIPLNNSASNLAVNGTQALSVPWVATAGFYMISLCADLPPVNGTIVESNEGNNCGPGKVISVSAAAPVCTIATAISWTSCISTATCVAPPATKTVTGTRVGMCADSSIVTDNTCSTTITCTPASVCPNTICEGAAGETPISCPQDCKVKYRQF